MPIRANVLILLLLFRFSHAGRCSGGSIGCVGGAAHWREHQRPRSASHPIDGARCQLQAARVMRRRGDDVWGAAGGGGVCGIERTVEVQGRCAAIMTTPASKARTRYGRPEAGSPVVSDV